MPTRGRYLTPHFWAVFGPFLGTFLPLFAHGSAAKGAKPAGSGLSHTQRHRTGLETRIGVPSGSFDFFLPRCRQGKPRKPLLLARHEHPPFRTERHSRPLPVLQIVRNRKPDVILHRIGPKNGHLSDQIFFSIFSGRGSLKIEKKSKNFQTVKITQSDVFGA